MKEATEAAVCTCKSIHLSLMELLMVSILSAQKLMTCLHLEQNSMKGAIPIMMFIVHGKSEILNIVIKKLCAIYD